MRIHVSLSSGYCRRRLDGLRHSLTTVLTPVLHGEGCVASRDDVSNTKLKRQHYPYVHSSGNTHHIVLVLTCEQGYGQPFPHSSNNTRFGNSDTCALCSAFPVMVAAMEARKKKLAYFSYVQIDNMQSFGSSETPSLGIWQVHNRLSFRLPKHILLREQASSGMREFGLDFPTHSQSSIHDYLIIPNALSQCH